MMGYTTRKDTILECRFTDSGIAITRFRLTSVPREWDAQARQWRDGAPIRYICTVWRDLARNAAESLIAGVQIGWPHSGLNGNRPCGPDLARNRDLRCGTQFRSVLLCGNGKVPDVVERGDKAVDVGVRVGGHAAHAENSLAGSDGRGDEGVGVDAAFG